jgi:hypothetical protein
LPSIIDRVAAVRAVKQLAAKAPQSVQIMPNDALHHRDGKVVVEIGDLSGRALVLFNIAGDGTVQMLYPIGSDPKIVNVKQYRLSLQVREPFGSDQVVAVTSNQPMPMLEQAIRTLDKRRSALQAIGLVELHRPADAKIGSAGIFTAP